MGKSKFYDSNLEPMYVEELNNNINQSLDDSNNNRMIKASDLKSKTQEWG